MKIKGNFAQTNTGYRKLLIETYIALYHFPEFHLTSVYCMSKCPRHAHFIVCALSMMVRQFFRSFPTVAYLCSNGIQGRIAISVSVLIKYTRRPGRQYMTYQLNVTRRRCKGTASRLLERPPTNWNWQLREWIWCCSLASSHRERDTPIHMQDAEIDKHWLDYILLVTFTTSTHMLL